MECDGVSGGRLGRRTRGIGTYGTNQSAPVNRVYRCLVFKDGPEDVRLSHTLVLASASGTERSSKTKRNSR